MKRYVTIFLTFVFIFTLITSSAFAGGDKVRGDKADGPSNQLGDCPFKG